MESVLQYKAHRESRLHQSCVASRYHTLMVFLKEFFLTLESFIEFYYDSFSKIDYFPRKGKNLIIFCKDFFSLPHG